MQRTADRARAKAKEQRIQATTRLYASLRFAARELASFLTTTEASAPIPPQAEKHHRCEAAMLHLGDPFPRTHASSHSRKCEREMVSFWTDSSARGDKTPSCQKMRFGNQSRSLAHGCLHEHLVVCWWSGSGTFHQRGAAVVAPPGRRCAPPAYTWPGSRWCHHGACG